MGRREVGREGGREGGWEGGGEGGEGVIKRGREGRLHISYQHSCCR